MKSKSTTGFLKEQDGFHVCHKSCMIFTNHPCSARFAQDAEIRTCTQSSLEASINEEVYSLECVGEEGIRDELSNKGEVFQEESTVTDSVTADSPESTQSTCTSNKVMIFSPILDSIKYQDEGSNNLYMRQLDSEDSDDCSKSSCEYQACNMSDVSISDMIFSGPLSGSHSVLDSKADFMFLPKYSCEESSLVCDLTEEPMVLPFLENTSDTGDHDGRKSEETRIDADYSSLYLETHQLRSYNWDSHINTLPDPDYECFDPQMYIRNLPDQPSIAFNLLPSSPPNEKQNTKQITLVLDLDETLVHSTMDHCDDADFTFPVFCDMQEHTVYVKQRPHLQTFLERVSEMFEIAVFTASESIYAEQLLDILDPDGKLISRRAYRESCVLSEGIYMKDLTILNVDLAKVVIIDNSPQVFRLQVNNGIPIKSWFDDPSDCALISLLPFLETLVDADDVRPIIARKFSYKE